MVIIRLRSIVLFLLSMLAPNVYCQDMPDQLLEAVVPQEDRPISYMDTVGTRTINDCLYHFVIHFLQESELFSALRGINLSIAEQVYQRYYSYLSKNDPRALSLFQEEARIRVSLVQKALALAYKLQFFKSDPLVSALYTYINRILCANLGDALPDPRILDLDYKGPKFVNFDRVVPSYVEAQETLLKSHSLLDGFKIQPEVIANMYNWDGQKNNNTTVDDAVVPTFETSGTYE